MRARRVLAGIAIGLVLVAALWTFYVLDYYEAELTPEQYRMVGIPVEARDWGWYVPAGPDQPESAPLLIYYPGGKVDEEAYIPLAGAFAELGVSTAIARMPFRLAVFGINRFRTILSDLEPPPGTVLALGGHSLGGAMAAVVADRAEQPFSALVIHGSYPPESSGLADRDLPVQSIWGARDSVAGLAQLRDAATRLPDAAQTVELPDGNHAGFGDYGEQDGDGLGSRDPGAQMRQSAALGARFLLGLDQERRSTE